METYAIKLDKRDLKILLENLNDISLKEKLLMSIENAEKSNNYIIKFGEQEIDKIQDCLSDLFVKDGLFENSEPNAFGDYIEDLIDRFSIE
jgi:hypothetical protein